MSTSPTSSSAARRTTATRCPNEVEACRKYLLRQIELIDPKLIVTLGRYSLAWFFPRDSISKVHGHAAASWDGATSIHMYHPAAALHAGNLRKVIEEDFAQIPAALEKARESQAVAVSAARSSPPPSRGGSSSYHGRERCGSSPWAAWGRSART